MAFTETFFEELDNFPSSPFLFIGAGFSRKYLQAENWEYLLRKYSDRLEKRFEKYRSLADSNWPVVGSLIAKDYHDYWFEAEQTENERRSNMQEMVNFSSPLKVSISTYLRELSSKDIEQPLVEDIELLKMSKISGIITTNYDLLCEKIFPDFRVYKSQQELIFSTLQEVGEIYKIHGCCSEPNSLVLTSEDYAQYNEKNAYLAAKLLTVFLEHPTIFLGYSISDENIRQLLSAMIRCLDQDQVNQLSTRLFFVQYDGQHTGDPVMDRFELQIGGLFLPLTRIKTKEFKQILYVLTQLHQKYSASLLRKIKEHIYDLVNTNDPSEKISVIDFDKDTDLDKVDIVIGVGVSPNSKKSYETYTRFDIAEDILNSNKNFDKNELLDKTLPKLIQTTKWVPVCKYLNDVNDKSNINVKVLSAYNRPLIDWQESNPYKYKAQKIKETYDSVESILEVNEPTQAIKMILLLDVSKVNVQVLEIFLRENFKLTADAQNSSYYMKLVCLCDRLRHIGTPPIELPCSTGMIV